MIPAPSGRNEHRATDARSPIGVPFSQPSVSIFGNDPDVANGGMLDELEGYQDHIGFGEGGAVPGWGWRATVCVPVNKAEQSDRLRVEGWERFGLGGHVWIVSFNEVYGRSQQRRPGVALDGKTSSVGLV